MHYTNLVLSFMQFDRFCSLHHQTHLRTHVQPEIVFFLRKWTINVHFKYLLSACQDRTINQPSSIIKTRFARQDLLDIFTSFLQSQVRLYVSYIDYLRFRKLSLNWESWLFTLFLAWGFLFLFFRLFCFQLNRLYILRIIGWGLWLICGFFIWNLKI